jgi:hypothetical protein
MRPGCPRHHQALPLIGGRADSAFRRRSSWDRKAAPSHVRLEEYRHQIAALAAPALARLKPPLALGFYVAVSGLACLGS